METGLTRNQILSELSKSPHGQLAEYMPMGQRAAAQDPDFFAHLIAWDRINGSIRDAKVALPIVSLMGADYPEDLAENSLAHLALMNAREFLRAFRFALEVRPHGRKRIRKLAEQYLHDMEGNHWGWTRIAVQHRSVLKELYCLAHVKPCPNAKEILFENHCPPGSVFEAIRNLKNMAPEEAASEIINRKIPFIVAQGALGDKLKDPDVLFALIKRMTSTELVTNTKNLEKWGMKTNPALRSAFEEGLKKASKSKKNVFKTSAAADAIEDEGLRDKLRGLQKRQIEGIGMEGDWLVMGDASSSMEASIEMAKIIAATLAAMVKGKVWLCFFNTSPQTINVTGQSLDTIKKLTKHVRASGYTSIGCGLHRMLLGKQEVDGIAIVSDGGENAAPYFHDVYPQYAKFLGKEPATYLYHCGTKERRFTTFMSEARIDLQVFDVPKNADYYSLQNLVNTMRANRYSLIDEVMDTKLLTLDGAFKLTKKGEEVYAGTI